MSIIVVVEDLTHAREKTISLLAEAYPAAAVESAGSVKEALALLQGVQPDLLIIDLGLPKDLGERSKLSNGIQILKHCMKEYPSLNITVQTAEPKALIRIKPLIDLHQGGFTVVDKTSSVEDMLRRVKWAREGLIHTREIRGWHAGIEMRREWLDTLRLASQEHSLQDKEIAGQMNVSEATIRHYWKKIQDVLEVYPESYDVKKNLRVMTLERARQESLID